MNKNLVAVVRYQKPLESVRQAVEMSHGLDHMPTKARVFIKPNIVFWTKAVAFPKWGVITTSRVVEDIVLILKERGIDDITIGEGTVTMNPKDMETPAHAFETLGYGKLKRKYGIDADPGLFEKIDTLPGFYMGRYEGKPDYDESFFQVKDD